MGHAAGKRWGVALGGGGGRTFAHLGVLRALHEAGLRPDRIAGSSMGAVLGALYAWRGDLDAAAAATHEYFSPDGPRRRREKTPTDPKGDNLHRRRGPFPRLRKSLATASVALTTSFRRGLLKKHPLYRAVDRLFPAGLRFEDLAVPFACVAMDLTTAELVTFTSGELAPALKAGVAVGLVFAPFRHEGHDFVDAAPASPVPVRACRALGAERVLAVDLCAPVPREHHIETGFEVVRRIIAVESKLLADAEMAEADLVVRPETGAVFWGDLSQVEPMARHGADAMGAALGAWREKIV